MLDVLMQCLSRLLMVFPVSLPLSTCIRLSPMASVAPGTPFCVVGPRHSTAGSNRVSSVMLIPKPPTLYAGFLGNVVAPGSLVLYYASSSLSDCKWWKSSKVLFSCFQKKVGPDFAKAYAFTGFCTEMVPMNAQLNRRW